VEELVRGVSILLDGSGLAACPAIDADSDGGVVISEAVQAVANALNGCPPECRGIGIRSAETGSSRTFAARQELSAISVEE
jgi:hypothetical protein